MISIFNKKNIAVDLEKFESRESNILLIIGESGAGKSTAAKYFAKKFNVPYFCTDDFFWNNQELHKSDPDLYKKKRAESELTLITSKERVIIEGVGITRMPKELTLKMPTIILGKSGLLGSFHAGLRNKRNNIGTGKFFPEFRYAFYRNFNELSKSVAKFRSDRISVKGSRIKELSTVY